MSVTELQRETTFSRFPAAGNTDDDDISDDLVAEVARDVADDLAASDRYNEIPDEYVDDVSDRTLAEAPSVATLTPRDYDLTGF